MGGINKREIATPTPTTARDCPKLGVPIMIMMTMAMMIRWMVMMVMAMMMSMMAMMRRRMTMTMKRY